MRNDTIFIFKIFLVILTILLGCPANGVAQERIVSLSPSMTESLYYLGLDDKLVAVTTFCNYPPQAKAKESIGTVVNPNVEKIFSLSPDLVLVVTGMIRPQVVEKLKGLGLQVVVFDRCSNFDEINKRFVNLGTLLGKEKEARKIVQETKREVHSIARQVEGLPPVGVFWEIGATPLVSVGGRIFCE